MNITIALIIAVYFIGIIVAYAKMKEWKQPKWQKAVFAVFWPLIGLLYIVHLLHNKL
jgi:hypothetical protein